MQLFNIPVLDGWFYIKLAEGMIISGPVSLVSESPHVNSVLLRADEVREWFFKATKVSFPFFQKERVFVIQPAQTGEPQGEYIVLEYTQEQFGLVVMVRIRIEPTGHDAVTLSPEVLDSFLDEAIKRHLSLLYS